jgi:hypothetical protein
MAERVRRKRRQDTPSPPPAAPPRDTRDADEAERSLGRAVGYGLPATTVIAAVIVGFAASVSSALLVLAAGVLLGAIALLWASVRTLSGDAPLSSQMESLAARRSGVDELAERKQRVLRALKDLEAEHAIGKIDDEDYGTVTAQYREEAKELMRQMDVAVAPRREEAERIAREYLEKHATRPTSESDTASAGNGAEAKPAARAERADGRVDCGSCGKSNDADAAFCKHCGAAVKGTPEKTDAPT